MQPTTIQQAMQLAVQHHQAGRLAEAEAIYRQVLAQEPNQADALHLLGVLAGRAGRFEEGIELIRRAIAIHPTAFEYHFNLASDYTALGRWPDAADACRRATELNPDHAESFSDLGAALRNMGQYLPAIAAYERAVQLKPDFARAHGDMGMALLTTGDFKRGWAEYEWRWASKDYPLVDRKFAAPKWRGEDLAGRRILLHAEQGFGDAIMFVRYAALVRDRGGKVIVECHRQLKRLLGTVAGIEEIFAQGEALPSFDLHCPMLSIPMAFRTDLNSIPANVPYISPDSALVGMWRAKLGIRDDALRVGLVWGGQPLNSNDSNRSVSLQQMSGLASVKDVRFVSLQTGRQAAQAGSPPQGMELIDVGSQLQDFAETAAVIANLDLVISVDTAVIHLAGAMGKPVWVLHAFLPDWRWMLEREDTPWYPTMRLFRQKKSGDWADVMQRVVTALSKLATPPD